MAHRRASRELSQEGRQPQLLTRPPSSSKKTHTHTHKLRDGELAGLPTCFLSPRSFIFHSSHLYHMDCRRTGFKRQHSNVLTETFFFFFPPLPYIFQPPTRLPVTKTWRFMMLTVLQLFLQTVLSVNPPHKYPHLPFGSCMLCYFVSDFPKESKKEPHEALKRLIHSKNQKQYPDRDFLNTSNV